MGKEPWEMFRQMAHLKRCKDTERQRKVILMKLQIQQIIDLYNTTIQSSVQSPN